MAQRVSIGTAWSEAADFVRREKKLLAPLMLALMVVPATVSQLVQPNNPFAGPGGFQPWMAIAVVALLMGLVGQMAVSGLAMGFRGPLGATIIHALKRLPVVAVSFVSFFLLVGLALIPLIVVLTLAGGGAESGASTLANFLTLLALFGAGPRILLAPAIAMNEQLGPWGLVKRTWRASRGQYWRLLGFFVLFLAASLIMALAVSAVVGSIATLALGPSEPMSVSRLLVALAGGLVQGIAGTLYAAMLGRIVVQLAPGSTSGT